MLGCLVDSTAISDVASPRQATKGSDVTDNFRIELGKRIREERVRAGYRNGRDFAAAVGLHPSQLSRLEHGLRRIDSILLRQIADKLNVTIEALMPRANALAAVARRGDANDEQMDEMTTWALSLRKDIDAVAKYLVERDV